jgi:hypothetical protein
MKNAQLFKARQNTVVAPVIEPAKVPALPRVPTPPVKVDKKGKALLTEKQALALIGDAEELAVKVKSGKVFSVPARYIAAGGSLVPYNSPRAAIDFCRLNGINPDVEKENTKGKASYQELANQFNVVHTKIYQIICADLEVKRMGVRGFKSDEKAHLASVTFRGEIDREDNAVIDQWADIQNRANERAKALKALVA